MTQRGQAHCHKLVAKVAREIAGNLYETLMASDQLWTEWQRQNPEASRKELERRFIGRNWGRCIEAARTCLALSLRSPNLDEHAKEEISEALILDATLMR